MICLSPRQVPYNPKQLLFEHGNVRENLGFFRTNIKFRSSERPELRNNVV